MAVNPIQVQKFLKGVDYPISKQKLIETAREQGADETILQDLEKIDAEEINSPSDVSEALGKLD